MVVTGIAVHVPVQLKAGISLASNGRDQMDVTGTNLHVPLQLKVDISPSFNGREQMVVTGIVIHVHLQLAVVISSSFNGRDQMDVTGTNIHLKQLRIVLTTKMCSITLLMKGALPGRVQLFRLVICVFSSIAKPQTL